MNDIGSATPPLKIAIVGAGPSGFYAADALFKIGRAVTVDLFDRLPAPYGLVRYGVAPDHQKLKQATQMYDRIAATPGFAYFGNVHIGQDVPLTTLRQAYHAVILSSGAPAERRLGVKGESLPGSHSATDFVGWYNGHPDFRHCTFDLSGERAIVIGQGNVAVDVARILVRTADELRGTDIAAAALAILAESKIREVWLIGRRGPAQVKFTTKELREYADLAACYLAVDPADLLLDPASAEGLQDPANAVPAKNVEILREYAAAPPKDLPRHLHFKFLLSPVEMQGTTHLEALVLEKNRLTGTPGRLVAEGTGERLTVPCGLCLHSVGFEGRPLDTAPFDVRRHLIPNEKGRVLADGVPVPGLYTAGWIKRGPTGNIGTNRACAMETVATLAADLPGFTNSTPRPGIAAILPQLAEQGVRPISFADWKRIDAAEVARGEPCGKPREKFTTVAEMLAALDGAQP